MLFENNNVSTLLLAVDKANLFELLVRSVRVVDFNMKIVSTGRQLTLIPCLSVPIDVVEDRKSVV